MKNVKSFSNFLSEGKNEQANYMFFQNLKTIQEAVEEMLAMDPDQVDALLSDGHGWALDHIATSKDDIEEVKGFIVNSLDSGLEDLEESQDFDTKLVDKVKDLKVGEEVFQLGKWKTVEKIEGEEAVLVDDKGAKSRLKQPDLNRNKAVVKVSNPDYELNTGRKETTRPVTGVKVAKKYTGKLDY